jgi:hypothetical protein
VIREEKKRGKDWKTGEKDEVQGGDTGARKGKEGKYKKRKNEEKTGKQKERR